MWQDRVSNPGPLTYEPGALPTALRGPAHIYWSQTIHTVGRLPFGDRPYLLETEHTCCKPFVLEIDHSYW